MTKQSKTQTALTVAALATLVDVLEAANGRPLYVNTRAAAFTTDAENPHDPLLDLPDDDVENMVAMVNRLALGSAVAGEDFPEALRMNPSIPTRVVTAQDADEAFGDPAEHMGPSSDAHTLLIMAGHGAVFLDYEVQYVVSHAVEQGYLAGADREDVEAFMGRVRPSDAWDAVVEGRRYGALRDEVFRAAVADLVDAARLG